MHQQVQGVDLARFIGIASHFGWLTVKWRLPVQEGCVKVITKGDST